MVEFRLLGPLEAVVDGTPVPLAAAKPRALLALLLLRRNRVVPVAELIDGLWGDSPPETATKALQGYVSQLRKTLGPNRLLTRTPGYLLRVDTGELDLDRFEELTRRARERLAAADAGKASDLLSEALKLWRGRPLAEFDSEPFARDARARLEEEHIATLEDWIDADLALGRHAALVPELEELVAAAPFRERLRGQLMLALYRSGRQADALEAYRHTRETLVEELGIEPGRELQELERAILRHDTNLDLAPPPVRARPAREGDGKGRRRSGLVVAAVVALALAGTAVAVALMSGSGDRASSGRSEPLAPFVAKLENFLQLSRAGRTAIAAAIDAAATCELRRNDAVTRLDRVQRNRQSLLQQVAALSVPPGDEALRASDLLQQSIQASIAADWHYRDWLRDRKDCAPPGGRDYRAARAADAQATRTKQKFVSSFNPLARRFDRKEWTAGEF